MAGDRSEVRLRLVSQPNLSQFWYKSIVPAVLPAKYGVFFELEVLDSHPKSRWLLSAAFIQKSHWPLWSACLQTGPSIEVDLVWHLRCHLSSRLRTCAQATPEAELTCGVDGLTSAWVWSQACGSAGDYRLSSDEESPSWGMTETQYCMWQ